MLMLKALSHVRMHVAQFTARTAFILFDSQKQNAKSSRRIPTVLVEIQCIGIVVQPLAKMISWKSCSVRLETMR